MQNMIQRWASAIACAIVAIVIIAQPAQAVLVYGVTEQDVLVSWDSEAPGKILSGGFIASLPNGPVQGIDREPVTGGLYGIGLTGHAFSLTQQGTFWVANDLSSAGPFLTGSNAGFDLHPNNGRMRVVTNADQNFQLAFFNGSLVSLDSNLAFASGDPNFGVNPNVTHTAYSNNVASATSTTLYGIDTSLDALVMQGGPGGAPSPNLGQLTTLGPLGINVAEDGGFDIFTVGGTDFAYAALRPVGSSVSNFYSINLSTGHATLIGEIGGGLNIRAMAVVPAPGAVALLSLAGMFRGMGRGSRRRRG